MGEVPRPKHGGGLVAQGMVLSQRAKFQLAVVAKSVRPSLKFLVFQEYAFVVGGKWTYTAQQVHVANDKHFVKK